LPVADPHLYKPPIIASILLEAKYQVRICIMEASFRKLIFLREGQLTVHDPQEDIRGRRVLNRDSQDIGRIHDLLVDERERRVRFMELASGGHFGFGEKKFLLPIDVITEIDEDAVKIDQTTERIEDAPAYDPAIVDEPYLSSVYTHYAFAPYWGLGYTYPPYPYYPPIPRRPRRAS
jgi:hypothetical protein